MIEKSKELAHSALTLIESSKMETSTQNIQILLMVRSWLNAISAGEFVVSKVVKEPTPPEERKPAVDK